MPMETDIVRGDIQTVGNSVKSVAEKSTMFAIREMWKLLKKLFKSITSSVYKNRIEGIKRIDKDGRTKEKDKISGLTYDEVQQTAVKYRDAEVPFVIIEEQNNDKSKLGERKTLSSINKFTNTRYDLEKAKERLEKKPNSERRMKKVVKLQAQYDKLLAEQKGKTFTIITNKSRQDFNNDRRIELIENRTHLLQSKFEKEFVKDDSETKVYDEARFNDFLEKVKAENKLVDLNQDQLATMFASLHKDGTVDVSKFKNNYYIHTVDADKGGRIVNSLEDEGIEFAVKKGKTVTGDEFVKIYVKEDDIQMYHNKGFSSQGTFQHYGVQENKSDVKDNAFTSSPTHTISVPYSKVREMNRLLKDEEYQFEYSKNNKGEKVGLFTISKEAALRAEAKELSANPVFDDLQYAKEQEAIRNNNTVEQKTTEQNKEQTISPTINKPNTDTSNKNDINIDIDVDIDKE